MKIDDNGIIRDMTEEEIARMSTVPALPYEQRVINRIRAVYSVDDELAILRQRDSKPEEFSEYNELVERIKAEERAEVL